MPMVELRGLSALEAWTRKVTAGYKDVCVRDLSTSWRDGLAFCALIHHFRPDLIDFDSLSKENILYNNRLAFRVAETELGVASLLDAEDMFKHEEPDRLSVATYLSQFYQCFEGSKSDRKQSITKPITTTTTPMNTTANRADSSDTTGANNADNRQPIAPRRHETKCCHCKTRVYVLDRVVIEDKLYHKSCAESVATDQSVVTQSEDNNNANDCQLVESCDQMPIDSSDKSIGVKSVDPIVSQCVANSKPMDNKKTTKPEIPAKSFQLIPKNVKELPKSDLKVVSNVESVPEDSKPSAEESKRLNDTYEESVADFDTSIVDEVFNKTFGKSVRISDQISQITANDNNTGEQMPTAVDNEDTESEEDNETHEDKKIYPDDKNPFDDEEDEEVEEIKTNRKSIYPDDKNPFGDEDEEEEEEHNQRNVKIRLRTPSDALNPFGDDDDEEAEEFVSRETTPKPKPRQSLVVTSSPSSAVSSPTSSVRVRKKRPAPTPPTPSTTASASSLPQVNSSGSLNSSAISGDNSRRDSVVSSVSSDLGSSVPNSRTPTPLPRHRLQKSADDLSEAERERIRHSSDMNTSVRSNDSDSDLKNKSASDLKTQKKRPAPPIPAVKRMVKGSLAEIEAELNSIGDKLPAIEKRGKELEELLVNNAVDSSKTTDGQSSAEDKSETNEEKAKREELVNEFLSTAKERCRLAKRQMELVYTKRELKLEEIQADIEYQMRVVISKQAAQKTDEDKKREEELLKRLVEIIEERNDIVENMIRDENKEVEDYQKLVAKVMPNKEPVISSTKEAKISSKHKSIDKNLVKLKDKLKLKDIKEKKKLKKEKKESEKSTAAETSSIANKSSPAAECPPKTKTNTNSSKHLLKSTLKPLKKSLGLKSSEKKSEASSQSSEVSVDSKTKTVTSDPPIEA